MPAQIRRTRRQTTSATILGHAPEGVSAAVVPEACGSGEDGAVLQVAGRVVSAAAGTTHEGGVDGYATQQGDGRGAGSCDRRGGPTHRVASRSGAITGVATAMPGQRRRRGCKLPWLAGPRQATWRTTARRIGGRLRN